MRHEQSFVEAARSVVETSGEITDVKSLRRWNTAVQGHVEEMKLAQTQFLKIQSKTSDDAARIAGEAATTATQVIDLIGIYGNQVNEGALGPAESAADAIEVLLEKLEAQARAWKQL